MDDRLASKIIERLDDVDDDLKEFELLLRDVAQQLELIVDALSRFRATQLRQDALLNLKEPGSEPPA